MGTGFEIKKALRLKPPKTKTRIPEISVSGVIEHQAEFATRPSYCENWGERRGLNPSPQS
jgi:hypothetical protein